MNIVSGNRSVALLLLVLLMAGCARNAVPHQTASSHVKKYLIAQPCLEILSAPKHSSLSHRLMVQVANVDAKGLPNPLGDWLGNHPVEIHYSAALLASHGVTVSAPWGPQMGDGRVSLISEFPAGSTDIFRFTVQIGPELRNGEHQSVVVTTRNQRPVVLPFPQSVGVKNSIWVLMPYLLDEEQDFRQLMACIARAKEGTPESEAGGGNL